MSNREESQQAFDLFPFLPALFRRLPVEAILGRGQSFPPISASTAWAARSINCATFSASAAGKWDNT